MELSTIAALIGTALAVATFFIGRMTSSHSEGRENGSLSTDIRYIKASIDRIEKRFEDEVARLEERADEVSIHAAGIGLEVVRARESARGAHHRLDEHLDREHDLRRF